MRRDVTTSQGHGTILFAGRPKIRPSYACSGRSGKSVQKRSLSVPVWNSKTLKDHLSVFTGDEN